MRQSNDRSVYCFGVKKNICSGFIHKYLIKRTEEDLKMKITLTFSQERLKEFSKLCILY